MYDDEPVFGGAILTQDIPEAANPHPCGNCGEETHVPDDRTGLIHINGKYQCFRMRNGKWIGQETVAEL